MNVEAINLQNSSQLPMNKASEQVSTARKKSVDAVQSEQTENNQVQPEELLNQIKSLTEDGLYSVRFENDERTQGLVVKIVDRETDEMIRQVPAEAMLKLSAILDDLRGNIVNTKT
jgi:flagellar protein FlaG